ncbi:hypothetical protein PFDG_02938 [Plasmodium falciparum Dd2]|uniref:Partial cleavage stimulation factor domain-containing protein n=1 Tax=Plasmodium falciparum (isolate Dd2) TaxID=57267 RepID=A0A0L7M3G3_PLAF4|nr:hypothetical protein PFDG_02938 [Plasmodium falciparum Dd2]
MYEEQNNICYYNEDVTDEKSKKSNYIKLKKNKENKKHIKIINKNGDITKEGLSILENMNMQDVVILIIKIQELVRMDPQTAIKMLNENKTIYYSLIHALFFFGILNVEITPLDNEEIKESHFYRMKNYFQYICMNDEKSTMQDFKEPKTNVDNQSENDCGDDSSYEYEEMINEDIISVEENYNEDERNDNTLVNNMDNTFDSDHVICDDDNKIYNNDDNTYDDNNYDDNKYDDNNYDDKNDRDNYHPNLINKKHIHVNKKTLYNNHQPYITNMKNDKKRKIQETPKTLLKDVNNNYGDNNMKYEDIYYNMNNDTSMECNNMKGVNNHNQFIINMRMKNNKQKKDYPYKSVMQEYIKGNDLSNNNNNINGCGNVSLSSDKRKGNLYGNNKINMNNNNNNNNNINNSNNSKNIPPKGMPKPLYSFIKNKDLNRNPINYDAKDFVENVKENAADCGDTLLHNYNNNSHNNNSSSSNNNLYKSNKEAKNHNENPHFYNTTNYKVNNNNNNNNNKQQLYRNNTDMRCENLPDRLINKMKHINNQRRGIKLIDRKNNPSEDNYNTNKIKIKCINIERKKIIQNIYIYIYIYIQL